MQRNIGETFVYTDGTTLKVEHSDQFTLCKGCYFYHNGCENRNNGVTGTCAFRIFKQMEDNQKEIKIQVPDGYEIDKQKSSFEKIVFKKIDPSWRNNHRNGVDGYTINLDKRVAWAASTSNDGHFIFHTKEQAASALAMARISQIIANDERFGGPITDEEWNDLNFNKYTIERHKSYVAPDQRKYIYQFLAFHTAAQRDLFLKENEDLVKDYLMV